MAQFLFYAFEENSSTITNRGTGGSGYNGTSVLGTGTPPNASATNMWHMGSNNYPYLGPFSGNYAICVPNGSSNQNQTTHSWEIGLYKTANGGLQKIWDKGVGAFAIQFMNDYLQVMRYSNNSSNQMYWSSSVTYPTGHYYYIQVSWNCGTPTSTNTPVVYIGIDGATPSSVNMGTKQGSGAGSWNSDSASCVNYGNYSTTPTTCPSTGGGYACRCNFYSIREYDTAISLPDTTRFVEDVGRTTYGTPSGAKQIEVLSWPTSGVTVTNTGSAGTTYNGTASTQNRKVAAPDGSTAWQFSPANTSDIITFPHGAKVNNVTNQSITVSFYLNGWGTNGNNILYDKVGSYSSERLVTSDDGSLYLWRGTTGSNADFWNTTNTDVISLGNWYSITVTWASGNAPGATPILYIDGASISLTHTVTGTGYWAGDSRFNISVGNNVALDNISDMTVVAFRVENQVVSAASAQAYYTTDSARFSQPTTLTIGTNTLSPSVYATVTLNGTLTSAYANPSIGSTITFWHGDVNDQNWATFGSTVVTDSSGNYTFDFIPSDNGGTQFNHVGASYDGNMTWQGSASQNLIFTYITEIDQAVTLTGQTLGCNSGVRQIDHITAGYSTTLTPTHVHGYSIASVPLDVEVDYDTVIPVTHVHAFSVPGTTPVSVVGNSTATLPVESAKAYGGAAVSHADYHAAPFTPIYATGHAIARTTIVTVSHIDQILGILPLISAYVKAIAGTDPTDVSRTDYVTTISPPHVHAGNIAGTQIVTVSHIDQILGILPSVAVNAVGWGATTTTSVVANSTGSLPSLSVQGKAIASTTPVHAIANYSKLLTTWAVNSDLTDIIVSTICHTFVNSSWVACNANSNTTLISASKVDQILVAFTPLTATAEAVASSSPVSVTRRDQGAKLDPMDTNARAISGTQVVTVSHIDQILGILPVVKANAVSIGATNDTDVAASSNGALDSNDVLAKAVAGTTPVKAVGHFSTLISPMDVHPDLTDVSVSTICNSTTTSSIVRANAISGTTVVAVSHIDQAFSGITSIRAASNAIAYTAPTYISRADKNITSISSIETHVNAVSGTQIVTASRVDKILGLLPSLDVDANRGVTSVMASSTGALDPDDVLAKAIAGATSVVAHASYATTLDPSDIKSDVTDLSVVATYSKTLDPNDVIANANANTTLVSASRIDRILAAFASISVTAEIVPDTTPLYVSRRDKNLTITDSLDVNANANSGTTLVSVSHLDQLLAALPSLPLPTDLVADTTPTRVSTVYANTVDSLDVLSKALAGTTPVSELVSYATTLDPSDVKPDVTDLSVTTTYGGHPNAISVLARAIGGTSVVSVSHIDQIYGSIPSLSTVSDQVDPMYRADQNLSPITTKLSAVANAISGTQVVTASHVDQLLAILYPVRANAVSVAATQPIHVARNDYIATLAASIPTTGIQTLITLSVQSFAWIYLNLDVMQANVVTEGSTLPTRITQCDHILTPLESTAAEGNALVIALSQITQSFAQLSPIQVPTNPIDLDILRCDAYLAPMVPTSANGNAISGTTVLNASRIDKILGYLPLIAANVNDVEPDYSISSFNNADSLDLVSNAIAVVAHASYTKTTTGIIANGNVPTISVIGSSTAIAPTSLNIVANALAGTMALAASHVDQVISIVASLVSSAANLNSTTQTYLSRADYVAPIDVLSAEAIVLGTSTLNISRVDQILALPPSMATNAYSTTPAVSTTYTKTLTTSVVKAFSVVSNVFVGYAGSLDTTDSQVVPVDPSVSTQIFKSVTPTSVVANALSGTTTVAISHIDQLFSLLAPLETMANAIASAPTLVTRADTNLGEIDGLYALVNTDADTQFVGVSHVDQILGILPSVVANVNILSPSYITTFAGTSTPTVALGKSIAGTTPVTAVTSYDGSPSSVVATVSAGGVVSHADAVASAMNSLVGIANDLSSTTAVLVSHIDQVFSQLAPMQSMVNAIASAAPTKVSRNDQNLPAMMSVDANANALANTQFIDISRVDQILAIIGTISVNPNAIAPSVEVDFAGVTDDVTAEVTQLCDTLPTAVSVDYDALPVPNAVRANAAVIGVSAEVHTASLTSIRAKAYALGNTTEVIVSHIDQVFASLFVLQAMANAIAGTTPVHPSRVDKNVPAMTSMRTLANAASGTSLVGVSHITIVFVLAGPLYTDAVIRAQTKETWVRVDWAGNSPTIDAYVEATAPHYTLSCSNILTKMVANVYGVAEAPTAGAHTYSTTMSPMATYVKAVADASPTHAYSYSNAYNRTVNSFISLVTHTSTHFDAELPHCPGEDIHSPVPIPVRVVLKIQTGYEVS